MLKYASGYSWLALEKKTLQILPLFDLQTINQLWVKYSKGRFSLQPKWTFGEVQDYGKFSDAKADTVVVITAHSQLTSFSFHSLFDEYRHCRAILSSMGCP